MCQCIVGHNRKSQIRLAYGDGDGVMMMRPPVVVWAGAVVVDGAGAVLGDDVGAPVLVGLAEVLP